MEDAADLETALPSEEEPRDEALVVAQGEPGDHQRDEGEGEEGVLDHLVDVHAHDLRPFLGDVDELAEEVDQPVQDHQTDDHGDRDDIDFLDDVGDRRAQTLTADPVDRGRWRSSRRFRVALPAGGPQVGGIDGRGRVRTGKNPVDAVTGGAVGDVGVAGL